ncbi:hypothetical protein MAP00_001074 [Monascus purpureus]|nr:hypothetical protein MAP00_001074 [Monascus purpureus]
MSKPPTLRPQSLQARLTDLLSRWPSDPVRPASVSVRYFLESRISEISKAQQPQQQPNKPQAAAPISESSVNALSSLLDDRYAKRYPLSPKLRFPASDPNYYDNLVREFEEAPGRNWLGRAKKRLSGLFRFE